MIDLWAEKQKEKQQQTRNILGVGTPPPPSGASPDLNWIIVGNTFIAILILLSPVGIYCGVLMYVRLSWLCVNVLPMHVLYNVFYLN